MNRIKTAISPPFNYCMLDELHGDQSVCPYARACVFLKLISNFVPWCACILVLVRKCRNDSQLKTLNILILLTRLFEQ